MLGIPIRFGSANHIDSDSNDVHDDKNINISDGDTVAVNVTATVTTPRIYKIVNTGGATLGGMMTQQKRKENTNTTPFGVNLMRSPV